MSVSKFFPNFFIIGMPRSGTKLFRELLNNHSEIFIPEIETLFIPSLIKRYGNDILSQNQIKEIVEEIRNSLFFFYYNNDYNFQFENLYLKDVTLNEIFNQFYFELANQRGIKAKILGDKSPNYINDIDLLLSNFPDSKFIHIVRDPRDYALSVNNAWNKNIMRSVLRWVNSLVIIKKAASSNPGKILEIRYEDLLDNTVETLKTCVDFLHLSYENEMSVLRKSVENLGDAKTAGVKKNNKEKYRAKMNACQIEKIENYTIEFLKYYNYNYSTKRKTNKPINRYKYKYLKILDVYNLIIFYLNEYGLLNGIKVMFKAYKHT